MLKLTKNLMKKFNEPQYLGGKIQREKQIATEMAVK